MRHFTDEQLLDAAIAYEEGGTFEDCADLLGCCVTTANHVLKDTGLVTPRAPGRAPGTPNGWGGPSAGFDGLRGQRTVVEHRAGRARGHRRRGRIR